MPTTPCPKCNGTGYLPHHAHVDGGRCWNCTGRADTSYTRTMIDPDEALARFHETNRQRSLARRARTT